MKKEDIVDMYLGASEHYLATFVEDMEQESRLVFQGEALLQVESEDQR